MDEQQNQQSAPVSAPSAENTNSADANKNKAMAIIGYILPILFFIPLLSEETKNSPFAKFHANQQLLLLIAAIIVNVVGGIVPIIGWFILLPIGTILLFVFAIMGIINAAKGEMKKLPLIGNYEIIK